MKIPFKFFLYYWFKRVQLRLNMQVKHSEPSLFGVRGYEGILGNTLGVADKNLPARDRPRSRASERAPVCQPKTNLLMNWNLTLKIT